MSSRSCASGRSRSRARAAHLGSSKGLQKARKRARREAAERGEEASADEAAAGSRDEGGGDAPPMTLEEVAALRCYLVRIVVRLGRNRVVRRLLAAVDLPVYHLKRVSIGPLHLTDDLGLAEPGTFCARLEGARAADCATRPSRRRRSRRRSRRSRRRDQKTDSHDRTTSSSGTANGASQLPGSNESSGASPGPRL